MGKVGYLIFQHMITAQTQMPFGKHKGKPIASIPAEYLSWLQNQIQLKFHKNRTLQEKELLKFLTK